MEIFADGSVANLSPWISLGGSFDGEIATVTIPTSVSTGLNDIFVIAGGAGPARTYFFARFNQFTGWTGWQPLRGLLGFSDPVAFNYSTPGNTLQFAVAVRDTNNGLSIRRFTGMGFLPDWQRLGASGAGTPAGVSRGPNYIEFFVRGADGGLFSRTSVDGGESFAPWRAMGGLIASNPVVASFRPGRWDLYVKGANGDLFYLNSLGGSTRLSLPGGLSASDVSLAGMGWGRLAIAVRGTDNQVFYRTNNGDVHSDDWQNLEGPLSGSIAAGSKPASVGLGIDKYTVFGRADDGQIYARGYENTISSTRSDLIAATIRQPVASVIGDFNNDNRPDIAIVDFRSDNVQVFLQNPDGTFAAPLSTAVGSGPVQLVAGDFNNDGILDLAVANQDSNNVSILLGTGAGTFTPAIGSPIAVDSAPFGIVAAVTRLGSTVLDLLVANQGTDDVSVLLGNGNGTFQAAVNYRVGGIPVGITVADFNNDGIPDIATANLRTNDVSILLGLGDGSFETPSTQYPTSGIAPIGIVAGDFNGDGNMDLAVSHIISDGVAILFGGGDGTFGPATVYPVGGSARMLAVVDYNGDGRLDLAVPIYSTNNLALLAGRFDGTFNPPLNIAVGDGPWGVTGGDINQDHRLDFVVPDFNQAAVTILFNTTPLP